MNAPVPIARGRTVRIDQTQRSAATVAGLAFLFTDATATFVQFWVRPATIVDNDAAKTAAAIAGAEWLFRVGIAVQLGMIAGLVTLTAALYMVLRPVGPVLALLAAFWRVVENAVLAVGTLTSFDALRLLSGAAYLRPVEADRLRALALSSIDAYGDAYSVSLLFGGLGLLGFAYLFLKSGYIPRSLAAWGVFGASLTVASTLVSIVVPDLAAIVYPWVYAPLLIFELGTAVWLLVRGLRPPETVSA